VGGGPQQGDEDGANNDAKLAAAAARGDGRALETLLARHADRVFAICRRVLGNREDARDAAQEALISIARRISSFDGRAQFSTWVYRVAVNAALDEARRASRRPATVHEGLVAEPVANSPAVDGAVADRIDIDRALQTLPVEFRAAVALRDLCGLDYAEIGIALGIPAGTVRSRIARGRALLAERLGNPGDPNDRLIERSP
jgi:RNA polymerase sigma-70 factor (ECF subfamily)